MDTKTRPIYMLSTRDPTQNKGHIETESEGLEKDIPPNRDQKKAGVAILISNKIDFKTKAVKRDKEGHYIMIKGSLQEEDIIIINIYAPNIGAPQYVSQNTGVGCHFLLQGIFPTQGLNLGLLHCRQTLYHLSHQGPRRWWINIPKNHLLCVSIQASKRGGGKVLVPVRL